MVFLSGEVVVDGKCTTLTSLSDFVANLEASGYFKKSVEIVSSQTEPLATPPGELIKFSVKGLFVTPGEPAADADGLMLGTAGILHFLLRHHHPVAVTSAPLLA